MQNDMNDSAEKAAPKRRQGSPLRIETFIGVDVPPEVKRRLTKEAENQGRPLASFVRRALERIAESLR
jgi:predicted HicB family RNase H-like nuclease